MNRQIRMNQCQKKESFTGLAYWTVVKNWACHYCIGISNQNQTSLTVLTMDSTKEKKEKMSKHSYYCL